MVRPLPADDEGCRYYVYDELLTNIRRETFECVVTFPIFNSLLSVKKWTEYTQETRDVAPTHLLTKIKSFSMLSKHKIPEIESMEFEAGDYKWKVKINLDGGEHISVNLFMVGAISLPAGWQVYAIFNFFLYNHISDKYLCFRGKAQRFHAINSEWVFSNLMTKKSLTEPSNGYIFKDKCVFGTEVFVIENKPLVEKVSVPNLSQPHKGEWMISNFSKQESSIVKPQDLSAKGNKGRVDSKTGKRVKAASFFCFGNKFNDKKHHSEKDLPLTMVLSPPEKKRKTMVLPPADDEEYTQETRGASPAHLLTKIKSFSMLLKNKITELESMVFEAGDYNWKVKINLDGGECISANLCMVGTSSLPAGWEVNAIFSFFIYNRNSDKYLCFRGRARRFHAINSECVFSDLISKKNLTESSNGYIFKDKCVFGAEVFVIQRQPFIEKVSVHELSNPYKREWKISEFSKIEEDWKSEEFSAGGYKWFIKIYPNGSGSTRGCYVSIFLECVDAMSFGDDKRVNAACRFCFRNNLNVNNDEFGTVMDWFASTARGWGFTRFIAIDDMRDPSKGFVVDDCCNFEIQLSVQAIHEAPYIAGL